MQDTDVILKILRQARHSLNLDEIVQALPKRSGLTRNQVSGLLTYLARNGLVDRQIFEDESNKRALVEWYLLAKDASSEGIPNPEDIRDVEAAVAAIPGLKPLIVHMSADAMAQIRALCKRSETTILRCIRWIEMTNKRSARVLG